MLVIDDSETRAGRICKNAKKAFDRYGVEISASPISSLSQFSDELLLRHDAAASGEDGGIYALVDLRLDQWIRDGTSIDGWAILKDLIDEFPKAKVVLYSSRERDPDLMRQAIDRGAYDLVNDEATTEDTERSILAVLAGFATLQKRLFEAKAAEAPVSSPEIDPLARVLLNVRVGLSIIGRHGHVWFQNKDFKRLCNCTDAEGKRCYKALHGWKQLPGRCPFCPTLEAVDTKQEVQRTLLLPVRGTNAGDEYRLACLHIASSPLWTDKDSDCPGAFETVRNVDEGWDSKDPIQRVLDLATMIAGVVASHGTSVRVNVHEISESKLSCRPVGTCLVTEPGEHHQMVLEQHVTLSVRKGASDWHEVCEEPGPASSTTFQTDTNICPEFDFDRHPAGKTSSSPEATFTPSNATGNLREAGWYDVVGQDGVGWHYYVVKRKDEPAALVEIGTRVNDVLTNMPDLELYLEKLGDEMRALRAIELARKMPPLEDFRDCDTEAKLWHAVENSLQRLTTALELADGSIWWHFRRLKSTTRLGVTQWILELLKDIDGIPNSPYCEVAKHIRGSRSVPILPPKEWKAKSDSFEDDEDALEGVCDPTNPDQHGSYLCRVSGKRRLRHVRPEKFDHAFREITDWALAHRPDLYDKLMSIKSYGDFPIGNATLPMGTLHIQSSRADLFFPPLVDYLDRLAQGVFLSLVRIQNSTIENALRRVRSVEPVTELLDSVLVTRLVEIGALIESAKMRKEDAALVQTLRRQAVGLSVLRHTREMSMVAYHDSVCQVDAILNQSIVGVLAEGRCVDIQLVHCDDVVVQGSHELLAAATSAMLRWAALSVVDCDKGVRPVVKVCLRKQLSGFMMSVQIELANPTLAQAAAKLVLKSALQVKQLLAVISRTSHGPLTFASLELAAARVLGDKAVRGCGQTWPSKDKDLRNENRLTVSWVVASKD